MTIHKNDSHAPQLRPNKVGDVPRRRALKTVLAAVVVIAIGFSIYYFITSSPTEMGTGTSSQPTAPNQSMPNDEYSTPSK